MIISQTIFLICKRREKIIKNTEINKKKMIASNIDWMIKSPIFIIELLVIDCFISQQVKLYVSKKLDKTLSSIFICLLYNVNEKTNN